MLKFCALLLGVCLLCCSPAAVSAGQGDSIPSDTKALLDLLINKGVITDTEAENLLRKAKEEALSQSAPATQGSVVPHWVRRLTLGGDLRLRYQGEFMDEDNLIQTAPENDDVEINTTKDRQRLRYRARLSLNEAITDHWRAAFRLATGNDNDPVSTNDTLGDSFNKDNILFDRAYLEWKPLSSLTLTGGRIPNPWFSTNLVWDKDLNFEGIALNYNHNILAWLSGFATVGVFPLEEVELSSRDKWLYGAQVGARANFTPSIAAQMGVAYYYYDNIVGEPYDPTASGTGKGYTAPGFMQKGNTLMDINTITGEKIAALASEFEELDTLATVDLGFWDPVHLVFIGEYVTNLGFDREEVSERNGAKVSNSDKGYMLGTAIGHPKVNELGKWNVFLFYKYLEANAVLDAFTDSDFHLGGTDAKGYILGTEIGVAHNVWMTAKWLSADEIKGPVWSIDVLQIDLSAKF